MKFQKILLPVIFVCVAVACFEKNPNLTDSGKDELELLEVEDPLSQESTAYNDDIYVPIYSDIYVDATNEKILLAATLSIRNTSATDSLFVSKINYFNTDGQLVRRYLDKEIGLGPMGTINYVIKREDDTGGTGANFIIRLKAKTNDMKPLIQAVMIGRYGNKGFSFLTDGYSVGRSN